MTLSANEIKKTTMESTSDEESTLQNKVKEKTKVFMYVLTFLSAIGGFLFGYDTGVVSGAILLIQEVFHLSTIWQEAIVSATIGAAWVFSLLGGYLADFFGRKPVIIIASFVFTVGAVVMGASPNKVVLLVGRIIVGIGIGLASMVVPMYIAEVSAPEIRGRLVTVNNIFITGGQFIASVICGAFSSDELNGWRYMLSLSGVPSLIQFIGFLGMPESPRWLIKKGRYSQAIGVLRSIRNSGTNVEVEAESIRQNCEESDEANAGNHSLVLWNIFKTPSVRRALVLGCALQMFQQLAGINTVMYYSASIIQMAGVNNPQTAIWMSAMTSGINFTCTFIGLYLVEKIGRRPLTLCSLAGVIASLVVLSIGFQLSAIKSPLVTVNETSTLYPNSACAAYSSCDACSYDSDCGFCYVPSGSSGVNGSCLNLNSDNKIQSLYGRCTNMTNEDFTDPTDLAWAVGFCPSAYQSIPIVGLCLYLFFFAPGMGPMPWTINSEIFPLWARSTCYAITTSTNWLFNMVVSMTFLSLTQAITKYGAFYLYAGLALLGLITFLITLPETRGKSLEEVEGLFAHPLCSCSRLRGHGDESSGHGAHGTHAVQYVHIRGLNTRDRQDSNESGDDT